MPSYFSTSALLYACVIYPEKLIVNNILFRQAFVSFTIVVPGKNSRRIKPISYFSSLNHFLTKLVSVRLKEGIRHEN